MSDPEAHNPQRALRESGLKPRKRLGQNFLRDAGFLSHIVRAAELDASDHVLEIGAGTGILTHALARAAGDVTAVELDDALCALLQRSFEDAPHVHIVHGNALDIEPDDLFSSAYKLVGNIPYYITGPIIRHFLEAVRQPDVLVFMVQLEVARRITALPGGLSLLGLSVQYYARPRIVTRVPAGAFFPPPKVDSAIIQLVPHRPPPDAGLRDTFFEVARAGFGSRRKQIANSLAAHLPADREHVRSLLSAASIDETRRAETLTLDEWSALAELWKGEKL